MTLIATKTCIEKLLAGGFSDVEITVMTPTVGLTPVQLPKV